MLIRFSVCTGSLSSWGCVPVYTYTHERKHIDIKYIICQLKKITDSRSQMALIALPNIVIYIWVGKHVQDNGIPHVIAVLSIWGFLQMIFSVSVLYTRTKAYRYQVYHFPIEENYRQPQPNGPNCIAKYCYLYLGWQTCPRQWHTSRHSSIINLGVLTNDIQCQLSTMNSVHTAKFPSHKINRSNQSALWTAVLNLAYLDKEWDNLIGVKLVSVLKSGLYFVTK